MSNGGSFRLTMRKGPTPGKVLELTGDVVTLGRDVGNDLVINDAEISRHHARLTREGQGYLLEDLGSTNGSFVNGHRITGPQLLKSGDLVGFGETVTLVFEAPAFDASATMIAGGEAPAFQTTMRPAPGAPPPPPAYPQAPPPPPPPMEAYSPRMDTGPLDAPPPEKKSNRVRYLLAGCGCLLLLVCIGVAVFLWMAPCEFYESLGLGTCPTGGGTLPAGLAWLLALLA